MEAMFTYKPDRHGPQETTSFGIKFVAGVPTEVTDPYAIQQLSRNKLRFEMVGGEAPKSEIMLDRNAVPQPHPSIARRAAEHEALQLLVKDGIRTRSGVVTMNTAIEAHNAVADARGEPRRTIPRAHAVIPGTPAANRADAAEAKAAADAEHAVAAPTDTAKPKATKVSPKQIAAA